MIEQEKIGKLNAYISDHEWFDWEVFKFDGSNLTLIGGTDLVYYHLVELIFKNVYLISSRINWRSDTSKPIFKLLSDREAYDFNYQHQIERGYSVYSLKVKDFDDDFFVVAEGFDFIIKK